MDSLDDDGLFDRLDVEMQRQWAYELRADLRPRTPVGSRMRGHVQGTDRTKDLSPKSCLVLETFDTLVGNDQQELARELRAGMRRRRSRMTSKPVEHPCCSDTGAIDCLQRFVVSSEVFSLDDISILPSVGVDSKAELHVDPEEEFARSEYTDAAIDHCMSDNSVRALSCAEKPHLEAFACSPATESVSSTLEAPEESPTKAFRHRVQELELERDQLRAALALQVSLATASHQGTALSGRPPIEEVPVGMIGFEMQEALEAVAVRAVDESESGSSAHTVIVSPRDGAPVGLDRFLLDGRNPDTQCSPPCFVGTPLLSSTKVISSGHRDERRNSAESCPCKGDSRQDQIAASPHRMQECSPTLLTQTYGYSLYHISAISLASNEGRSQAHNHSARPGSPFCKSVKSVKNLLLW